MKPRTSDTHPLQIAFVETPGKGKIGMTFCPGKHDPSAMTGIWERDLQSDLAAIANWGATALVTLMEQHELERLKVYGLGEMAIGTNRGIKQYTLNMLFDEKIGDTIHCALGRAYKDNNGVNESAVHVDMIKNMKEGEITAGDEVIYSKGKYFWEK